MYLLINTAERDNIQIILAKNDQRFVVKNIKAIRRQSEKLLPTIEKILLENKISLGKLMGIGVVSGPGGFASLRIGVVTANTLAYALKIPIVAVRLDEFKSNDELVKNILKKLAVKSKSKFNLAKNIVLPHYGQEPNITIKNTVDKL